MKIISRAEWGARPPKGTPTRIPTPTPELWLHHTASSGSGAAKVRQTQNFHMDSRGWSDIAYSFIIDVNGDVYEGRGAGISGGHTRGHNYVSHAICLLGNYNLTTPSAAALGSIVDLVAHGASEGWWPNQLTGGHRDTRGSNPGDCPGDKLYPKIPEINRLVLEDDMPLTDADIERVADAAAKKTLGTKWSESASVLQAIGRTYERTILGSENVSDAELEAAIDEMIAVLPARTIDLLKQKL